MVFSMTNIKLLKVDLITTSPLVIGVRESERGTLYISPKQIIPGVSFHGALMKALSDLGIKSVNEENALKTFTTPLYPTSNTSKYLFKDINVAHVLSFYGKGLKQKYVISCGLRRILEDFVNRGYDLLTCISNTIRNFMSELEEKAIKYGVNLLFNVADMKSAQGLPIEKVDSLWCITSVKKGIYIENVVDRARGSVYVGTLYGYEYVESGSMFTGYIACYDGLYDEVKDLRDIEVSIGKGRGRGFGKARVRVSELSISELRDLCPIREGLFIVKSLAPTFTVDVLPRPIIVGDVIETLSGLKLKVLGVIGSNTEVYSGWSRLYHTPKISIECNSPGTLFIMDVEDGVVDECACMELLLGLIRGNIPGFNMFQPITWSVHEDPLYMDLDEFIKSVVIRFG